MNKIELSKHTAALEALKFIEEDMVVGIGTGTTVKHFISMLPQIKNKIGALVASSIESEQLLKDQGLTVTALNSSPKVDLYIDGADAINQHFHLIKGGGGALTREKIIASASAKFICIAEHSKYRKFLSDQTPLPIEVIPMARSHIARQIIIMGGQPQWRENFVTDNGNHILDVYNLNLDEPMNVNNQLNSMPGIVEHGLFIEQAADLIILGDNNNSIIYDTPN